MRSIPLAMLASAAVVLSASAARACGDYGAGPMTPAPGGLRLSGPHVSGNLTVFLVHGPNRLAGGKLLSLQEALEQNLVVVHETGVVSALAIENVSADADVFVMGGDIVKGGRQDRVLPYDMIVPAKSGRLPLASFCVEAGRWSGRAGEADGKFGSSAYCLAGKGLKLAARGAGAQQEVWRNVAAEQGKLAKNVKSDVQAEQSKTSLQLTLENKKVQEAADAHVRTLAGVIEGRRDVIGLAVVMNGQVSSVDVYGSAALFAKLWPKLVRSIAVEAVAEQPEKPQAFPAVSAAAVADWMVKAETDKVVECKPAADGGPGKVQQRGRVQQQLGNAAEDAAPPAAPRMKETRRETEKCLVIETADTGNGNAVVRKSWLAK
mgnify:CR=1 FL=1